jgi:hypothetical protein
MKESSSKHRAPGAGKRLRAETGCTVEAKERPPAVGGFASSLTRALRMLLINRIRQI